MDQMITIFEIIGTIAFAISGAITALKAGMDIFGVIILGVFTATAGGVLRDVVLGHCPPEAFIHPRYVFASAITACIVFAIIARQSKHPTNEQSEFRRLSLLFGDSIGLGVFTVLGMNQAIKLYGVDNGFLIVFSGVITGVGGGVLRDVIIHELPAIFRKHIYALASIAGALIALPLFRMHETNLAIYMGSFVVLCIRLMASHYKWSLPRVVKED